METIEFSSKIENGIIKIPQKFRDVENANVRIQISEHDFMKKDSNTDKIGISIKKEIINTLGINYIQTFLEQQIQFLYIEQIKQGIDKSIAESSVDNYSLLEKARENAWDIYKGDFLKNIKTD